MKRRLLLKEMGVVLLSGSFPAVLSNFLSSCKAGTDRMKATFFSNAEFLEIEQLTDCLLPPTSTPGGLDVQVPAFVDMVVKNCLSSENQQMIQKGLQQLDLEAGGRFVGLSRERQEQVLRDLDAAAFKNDETKVWFRVFKKLATIGYFTSQQGMEKALRYVKVPGDYKACIPYKKGDKALAKTFLMYW